MELDYTNLRRYGLGKFNLMVDAFVDNSALIDEECGDVEGPNHFALVVGPFPAGSFDYDEGDERLTPDEENFLRSIAGAIVETNNDGFVSVNYYASREELLDDWKEITARVETFYAIEEKGPIAKRSAYSLRNDFVYSLYVGDEDDDPEGHFASGDDAQDAETVAQIREEREWNVWAWASVIVTARHPDIDDVEGSDSLGACSYKDEADFKAGGYYADMCERAADELEAKLERLRAVLLAEAR